MWNWIKDLPPEIQYCLSVLFLTETLKAFIRKSWLHPPVKETGVRRKKFVAIAVGAILGFAYWKWGSLVPQMALLCFGFTVFAYDWIARQVMAKLKDWGKKQVSKLSGKTDE